MSLYFPFQYGEVLSDTRYIGISGHSCSIIVLEESYFINPHFFHRVSGFKIKNMEDVLRLIEDPGNINFFYTFDSGQAFRWTVSSRGFTGVVDRRVVNIKKEGKAILILSNREEGVIEWFKNYFMADLDLERALEAIDVDPYIHSAIEKYRGLRLLRQEPWETLVSFIISANNNIPRIKGLVEKLSSSFGEPQEFQGKIYYSFPEPEALLEAGERALRELGVGFRASHIINAARFVTENPDWEEIVRNNGADEGREFLKKIKGVGDKIADCVLLYAFSKMDVFPRDVWINRVLEKLYFRGDRVPPSRIRTFLLSHFGSYMGLAQLYLYYWARRELQV
ncbi:MAG TPA: hypothetical protein ENG67_01735 [candidate division WOR-3 bacterium]|uniref:DNA-(apurinic or apyrimidinic site) lyase n=1 Tax=candidate division WOR-3 bacterium TaxID=2052148 RepID=A0A7C1BD76_UNCW3|nr:hypothetical protein [candidate division WOR-3 bacterium]